LSTPKINAKAPPATGIAGGAVALRAGFARLPAATAFRRQAEDQGRPASM
jgi:hypothetical protein